MHPKQEISIPCRQALRKTKDLGEREVDLNLDLSADMDLVWTLLWLGAREITSLEIRGPVRG